MVTQTRSGSSFVGEIFNQNPGVGYFYEPLYPFGQCSRQVNGVGDYFPLAIRHNFTAIQNLYKKAFSESSANQINGYNFYSYTKIKLTNLSKMTKH